MAPRHETSERSMLLEIPTELRLEIYGYCIADSRAITITSASIDSADTGPRQSSVPGLPDDHIPLVKLGYDASLLSITSPPSLPSKPCNTIDHTPSYTPQSLLSTCRQINDELTDYMRGRTMKNAGELSVYVSYPYGICVLNDMYPFLVCQAAKIHVSGHHTTSKSAAKESMNNPYTGIYRESFDARFSVMQNRERKERMRRQWNQPVRFLPRVYDVPKFNFAPVKEVAASLAPKLLARLVRTVLSPTELPGFQVLDVRVFYPGDSYSTVWSDDDGPIVKTLANTCGGKINMEVLRGNAGNAVQMVTSPSPKVRCISSVWKRLGKEKEDVDGSVNGKDWGVQVAE